MLAAEPPTTGRAPAADAVSSQVELTTSPSSSDEDAPGTPRAGHQQRQNKAYRRND